MNGETGERGPESDPATGLRDQILAIYGGTELDLQQARQFRDDDLAVLSATSTEEVLEANARSERVASLLSVESSSAQLAAAYEYANENNSHSAIYPKITDSLMDGVTELKRENALSHPISPEKIVQNNRRIDLCLDIIQSHPESAGMKAWRLHYLALKYVSIESGLERKKVVESHNLLKGSVETFPGQFVSNEKIRNDRLQNIRKAEVENLELAANNLELYNDEGKQTLLSMAISAASYGNEQEIKTMIREYCNLKCTEEMKRYHGGARDQVFNNWESSKERKQKKWLEGDYDTQEKAKKVTMDLLDHVDIIETKNAHGVIEVMKYIHDGSDMAKSLRKVRGYMVQKGYNIDASADLEKEMIREKQEILDNLSDSDRKAYRKAYKDSIFRHGFTDIPFFGKGTNSPFEEFNEKYQHLFHIEQNPAREREVKNIHNGLTDAVINGSVILASDEISQDVFTEDVFMEKLRKNPENVSKIKDVIQKHKDDFAKGLLSENITRDKLINSINFLEGWLAEIPEPASD